MPVVGERRRSKGILGMAKEDDDDDDEDYIPLQELPLSERCGAACTPLRLREGSSLLSH